MQQPPVWVVVAFSYNWLEPNFKSENKIITTSSREQKAFNSALGIILPWPVTRIDNEMKILVGHFPGDVILQRSLFRMRPLPSFGEEALPATAACRIISAIKQAVGQSVFSLGYSYIILQYKQKK